MRPYNQSLSLLTDLYQLTMAYGYFKNSIAEKHSVFHMFFRKNPFKGGYTIAAGLESVIKYLKSFSFDSTDLEYLSDLTGNDGKRLFDEEFLDYLQNLEFSCDLDAVPEGTAVFPHEPLLRIQGPLIQCQLLETPILNMLNFQTLIATKSSRICQAACDEPVLEFGLRRAQGIDGALSASRAAYIGGCAATSNVLAGKIYDIPVKGTHAHSWVMTFESEIESFEKYAAVMPNNCVFLVDTYNTLDGVRNAVKVGKSLKEKGYRLVGIRLDSGDLAYLSQKAREILDQEGFTDTSIIASNDLDEHVIHSLKHQQAKINIWGVGTRLVTGYNQPALGGVYKLSADKDADHEWKYRIKLSEQKIKISTPGILQIRRFKDHQENLGDMIFDITSSNQPLSNTFLDPMDSTRMKSFNEKAEYTDLLIPVFRKGELIYNSPSLHGIRRYSTEQLDFFHYGVKRFINPHQYPVGLEKNLYSVKDQLILEARSKLTQ